MFDEYFNPLTIDVSLVQEATALRAEVLADSPVSTSIGQDALSTSIPSSQEHEKSPIIFMMIHLINLLMKTRLLMDHHL
ncbi:hypothetical protein Tco_0444329, partial [Tanacetum coccineum]